MIASLLLVPFAQTFCDEQLVVGMYSIRNAERNTDDLDFSTSGLDFAYWNFFGNDNFFLGLTGGVSSGDEKIFSPIGCANIDLTERTIGAQIGYDIEGAGSTSDSEDYASFDIGTWFGDPGKRLQFAFEGFATDEQVISVGMYRAFVHGVALAGFLKTPKDELGSSWKVPIGVGWSF